MWARGGGPSHTTQKSSRIGGLGAYNCPYITVFDTSNIPDASSFLLVCAHIAIAVRVLWVYLKPGRFQAREFSRHIPNWLYVYDAWHIKNGYRGATVRIKAPYPRRFLGRVGRTPPYRPHSLGDGSKCRRGKGLKPVCIAPRYTSVSGRKILGNKSIFTHIP